MHATSGEVMKSLNGSPASEKGLGISRRFQRRQDHGWNWQDGKGRMMGVGKDVVWRGASTSDGQTR